MKLSFPRVQDLIKDYLDGSLSVSAIAKKYEVSSKSVEGYVAHLPKTRVDLEKTYFNERIKWENGRIQQLKEKYFNNIDDIMDSFKLLEPNQQVKALDTLNSAVEKLDKQFRLNNEMATEHIKEDKTTKVLDAAKILKELNTPEAKNRFLLDQIKSV